MMAQLITEKFKKFYSGFKNLNDQVISGRSKSVDSEDKLQTVKANSARNIGRVSGEVGISQFGLFYHLHDLSKY